MIARPPSQGGEVNHGSGIVLRYEERFFFLTAAHVIKAWSDKRATDASLMLHLAAPRGSAKFEPGDRLAHYDLNTDLAVLRLSAEEAFSTGLYPYDVLSWPPPAPIVGEQVFIAGLPLQGRSKIAPIRYEFLSFTLGTQVSTVASENFKCLFKREDWITQTGMEESPPASLGGVSGGPVMAMRGLRLTLLGVVSEHSEVLDLLVASRLDSIPESAFSEHPA